MNDFGAGDDGHTTHPTDQEAPYDYDVDHYGHDGDVLDHVIVELNRYSHQQMTKNRRKPSIKSTAILRVPDGTIVSLLTISAASAEDSGRYECRPSNLETVNVTLHVLDGKHGSLKSVTNIYTFCHTSTGLSVTKTNKTFRWLSWR